MSAESSGKQQPIGRPFPKGTSGNKGGRPKGYNSFRKAFRDEKDDAARRKRLAEIRNHGEDKDALMAIRLEWEYGYGKPPSAPDDNAALRESGARPLVAASSDAILDALKKGRE